MAVVGHFPFLPKVRQQAANLWVLENNPREGDFGPERAEVFPRRPTSWPWPAHSSPTIR
ncbi:MAG: hypothetical protein AB7D37_13625 [Desulfovibrio sp.]